MEVFDQATQRRIEAEINAISNGSFEQQIGDYKVISVSKNQALKILKAIGKPRRVLEEKIGDETITHIQIPAAAAFIPPVVSDIGWYSLLIILGFVFYVMTFYIIWPFLMSLRGEGWVRQNEAEQELEDQEQLKDIQEWHRKQAEKRKRK